MGIRDWGFGAAKPPAELGAPPAVIPVKAGIQPVDPRLREDDVTPRLREDDGRRATRPQPPIPLNRAVLLSFPQNDRGTVDRVVRL